MFVLVAQSTLNKNSDWILCDKLVVNTKPTKE